MRQICFRRAVLCLVFASGLLGSAWIKAPSAAWGEEPAHKDLAAQAYERGEYSLALELHERAYAATKEPERLVAIGLTKIRLGRADEGMKDCLAYFKLAPAPQRSLVESCFAEAQKPQESHRPAADGGDAEEPPPSKAPPPPGQVRDWLRTVTITNTHAKPRVGLIVAGASVLGLSWLCSAALAGPSSSADKPWWPMVVPVLGPWIRAGYENNGKGSGVIFGNPTLGTILFSLDGLAQATGFALLVVGAVAHRSVPVDNNHRMVVVPMLTANSSGLILLERF